MNKFVNIWLFLIAIISFPFAVASGANEDFSILGWRIEGQEFEHYELIFGVTAGVVMLFGAFKASRRWMTVGLLKQKNRFLYTAPVSLERIKRISLYGVVEIIFLGMFATFFIYASPDSLFLGLAYIILASEHLIHLFVGLKGQFFAVGITKKAVVAVDREARVMYFSGLRKIARHQQTLYFEYKNDLVLHMPLNMLSDETEFVSELRKVALPEKVFYTGFDEQLPQ
jgi:hypothetical protein